MTHLRSQHPLRGDLPAHLTAASALGVQDRDGENSAHTQQKKSRTISTEPKFVPKIQLRPIQFLIKEPDIPPAINIYAQWAFFLTANNLQ